MRKSETLVQFSCETRWEYLRNEWRRGRGKLLPYVANRYAWSNYPRLRKVPPFPLNVDIEVSSICQLKCKHCFRQYMNIGESGLMDLDLYRDIVAECGRHGLFTLKFSMRGEPLLHPDIVEMVQLAKASGIKEVWINTNGGAITEKLAKGIMVAGVDWITMSFDGLGEHYEAVRIPLKYEESLEKLKILRRVRDSLGANTLLNVQTIWSAIRHAPQEYIGFMKTIVDRVAYNPDMRFDVDTVVPDPDFVCPRLWQRICITSSGNYLKCPSDFRMQEVLGNVRDMGIKRAWDELQGRQRLLHLQHRRLESPVCAACHHGAMKRKVTVEFNGSRREDFNYKRRGEAQDAGAN